ncbi:MAG: hypothetical protein HFJ45_04155 [Clostridia bacterium]|nr:hypothetical protein [Clostridia bacterium]
MKSKKVLISLLVMILICSLTVVSFAINNEEDKKKSKKSENTIISDEEKDDLLNDEKNEVNNKTEKSKSNKKSVNEIEDEDSKDLEENDKSSKKDTEIKDENDKSSKKDTETKDKNDKSSKDNTEIKDESDKTYKNDSDKILGEYQWVGGPNAYSEKISKDLIDYNNKNIEYSNCYIDGNVIIFGGKKVTIKDCQIAGDIIIFADEIEFINNDEKCIIEGTAFLTADDIVFDGRAKSVYALGGDINFKKLAHISNDVRILGENVKFNSVVGRDVNIISEKVEILEDTTIWGNGYIETDDAEISDECEVLEELKVTDLRTFKFTPNNNLRFKLFESLASIIIILVIAGFVLGGFPKFTEVNSKLHLRDFVKTFFTGLLELFACFAIAILLMLIGHGIGYAFLLIALSIVLAFLGKALFIIAFSIRIGRSPNKISKIKVFFMTIIIALGVEAIGYFALLGSIGYIIVGIFNFIIGISGFGAMMTVIFTPNVRVKKVQGEKKSDNNLKSTEIDYNQKELREEIKNEIKEEIKELQEEKEIEKKLEENDSKEKNVEDLKIKENDLKEENINASKSQEPETKNDETKNDEVTEDNKENNN